MSGELRIERAMLADAGALSEIGQDTFTEKFGHLYAPHDLETFLQEAHSPEWYRQAITDEDLAIWLIRANGERLAAYSVAGPNTLPHCQEDSAGEIKRIYVQRDYQGQGIGKRLVNCMLTWLEDRHYNPIYVGVYSDNIEAQRFYQRFGFDIVGEYIFPVGQHQDREFIMKKMISDQ